MKITITASCQTGLVRKNNEDVILISQHTIRDADESTSAFLGSNDRYVVAVCDGLGGQNAGEVASMDAIVQLSNRVDTLRPALPIERVSELMSDWIKSEHEYLLSLGKDDCKLEGMGTTLVAILFYEGRMMWMNCGDSRIYRMRNGILCQLSTDHSLFNMTHNPADSHVVVNCLGGGAHDVFLDIVDMTDQVRDGDMFLLCSDGLTDMLSDDRIEQVLSVTPTANALTDAAIQCGGYDNVSACVLKISGL